MPSALLTGRPERVHDFALALKDAGFDVLEGQDEPGLFTPGAADCHIHLAAAWPPPDEMAAGWAEQVLPGDGCRILIVSDPGDGGLSASDLTMLRVLVEAAGQRPGRIVRVEIFDGPRSLGGPSSAARTGQRDWARYADMEPDLAYADWRNEVMALTSEG